MTPAVDLQSTTTSLGRQAEVLVALQLRYAQLRDAGVPSHELLGAATAAIDAAIDACLGIAESAAVADPTGEWRGAVTELERQLRRLGVLRSQILALYVVPATRSADHGLQAHDHARP